MRLASEGEHCVYIARARHSKQHWNAQRRNAGLHCDIEERKVQKRMMMVVGLKHLTLRLDAADIPPNQEHETRVMVVNS